MNYLIKKELIISKLYILRKNHSIIKYLIIKYWYVIKYFFKGLFNFSYFGFLPMLITGKFLESSLKTKQQIININV